MLSLGRKDLGSSYSLNGFFLVCCDNLKWYVEEKFGVFGFGNVFIGRRVVFGLVKSVY